MAGVGDNGVRLVTDDHVSRGAVVGVVPAAGYATRLRLPSGSKELVAVRGRALLDHFVERLLAGGATRIVIVTREAKEDVVVHATRIGAEVVLGDPPHVGASIALGVATLPDDCIVLTGFPDTIWAPIDGFDRLRRVVEQGEPLALGLFTTPHPERCDVASVNPEGRVTAIVTKPEPAPSNIVYGSVAARARQLQPLDRYPEPGRYFDELARSSPLAAVMLGRMIDVGTAGALEAAPSDPVFDALQPRGRVRS